MTVVRLPSPPMCKTTTSTSYINKVTSVFANTPKILLDEKVNGWMYKVDINVDGQIFSYTVSESVFTDSDGRQYSVDGKAMIASLDEIYSEINVQETEYAKNKKTLDFLKEMWYYI